MNLSREGEGRKQEEGSSGSVPVRARRGGRSYVCMWTGGTRGLLSGGAGGESLLGVKFLGHARAAPARSSNFLL